MKMKDKDLGGPTRDKKGNKINHFRDICVLIQLNGIKPTAII